MGTLLHFKDLYTQAFENCKPVYLVVILKVYSFFSALLIFLAIYAFIYRAATGFEF